MDMQDLTLGSICGESGDSEAFIRTFLEKSLDAFLLIDEKTGNILGAHPRVETVLGYKPSVLAGRHIFLLIPDPGNRGGDGWRRTLAAWENGPVSQDFQRADGETCHTDLVGHAVSLETGPGVLAIFHDVTEHRRSERRCEEMLELVEKSYSDTLSILEALRMGILLTDENQRVAFACKDIETLTGRKPDALLGKKLGELDLLSPECRRRLEEMAGRPPEDRSKVAVRLRRADGKTSHVEVEVHNDPRNEKGRIFCFYDVSDVYDLRRMLDEKHLFRDMVAKSDAMRDVFQFIEEVAEVDVTVLIEGATGTGKEMVARAIHNAGPRGHRPFVALNCAGLTDSLLTSQLFGHKRGAFTGAVGDHLGLFETANGGTVFLDEIGDIPMNVQTALLRVLQEREIMRLGESTPRPIDVRVVAATHRDLDEAVAQGVFRLDLLYRIRVARISLPPLRRRREDIPLLAAHFLQRCRAVAGKPIFEITDAAMGCLLDYRWPGNVRELLNAVEFAVLKARHSAIQAADLPPEIQTAAPDRARAASPSQTAEGNRLSASLRKGGDAAAEGARFADALERANGNRSKAAKLLGISRATFYRRLSRLKLPSGPP